MSQTDWEELYQKGDTRWEKGEASPGLIDYLDGHFGNNRSQSGTVLVPGCGTGHDVRAWAGYGFQVTGVDIAPSAIRLCEEKTAAAGLSDRAGFRLANFLRDQPFARFDYVFEHTLFCAIQKEDRDVYVSALNRWLKPKGTYVAVFYLIPDEDGPPFGSDRDEIVRRFSPSFKLLEDWVPRSYANRTGLEWMTVWRRSDA